MESKNLHHNNHKFSSSNHNAPQHQKNNGNQFKESERPEYLKHEYGITKKNQYTMHNGYVKPVERKSTLSRIRERFQEKPVTQEELVKLKMKAQKETYKTQIQKAKSSRPSRFSGFGGGGSGYSGRRSGSRSQQSSAGSWLLDNNNSGGGFMSGGGSGPSFDFITGANQKPSRGKPQRSGLEDMFT